MNSINQNKKAVSQLFQFSDFSLTDLVQFAEEGHGFSGNEGNNALTYPSDRDEYEIIHEGASRIPNGHVEISYWTGENSDVFVALDWYLEQLREYLKSKGELELSNRVDNILQRIKISNKD